MGKIAAPVKADCTGQYRCGNWEDFKVCSRGSKEGSVCYYNSDCPGGSCDIFYRCAASGPENSCSGLSSCTNPCSDGCALKLCTGGGGYSDCGSAAAPACEGSCPQGTWCSPRVSGGCKCKAFSDVCSGPTTTECRKSCQGGSGDPDDGCDRWNPEKYWCTKKCCTGAKPDAPVLDSPPNGYISKTQQVTLDWDLVGYWGANCILCDVVNTNQYFIYVGFSLNNLTRVKIMGSTQTSYAYTVSSSVPSDQPIYWRVDASNGCEGALASSETRYFFYQSCNATPPTNIVVESTSLTSAKVTWIPGQNGVSQKVFVDRNKTRVESAVDDCPNCLINETVGVTKGTTDNPFYTGSVLNTGRVYYYKIVTYKDSTCSSPSAIAKAVSSCELTPTSMTIQVGDPSQTLTASVADSSEIDRITFQSLATGYVKVNPAHPDGDIDWRYQTEVSGIQSRLAPVTVKGRVYFTGTNLPVCIAEASVTVTSSNPWWQVIDGDVSSGGNITSKVANGEYFDLKGAGGYPGIPAYTNNTNLTSSTVSEKGWIVEGASAGQKAFSYDYFVSQIPQDIVPTLITSSSITNFPSAPNQMGYKWYKYTRDIDLKIDGNITLNDSKVVLLVENANLYINKKINLDDGKGFFLAIVKGNINISSGIGGGTGPHLEGLYFADESISTGTTGQENDTQLYIRGSLAGGEGISIQRNPGGSNNSPAEIFEYAPDQVILFPPKLSTRRISWKEVAP